MTEDGAATSPSEDVTDLPSLGLLPQLIEVLHALTDGQELLSRKVREARLQHTCLSPTVVERRLQAEPADDPSSRVRGSHDGSIGMHGGTPTDNFELDAGPTSIDGFDNASLHEPRRRASAAPESATVLEAESPLDTPDAIATRSGIPAHTSSEASARTDWLNSVQPGETTAESLNRNYNFFDELDQRLADLEDPVDRSEG